MTREENHSLIRQAQTGDKKALERAAAANMGLCKSIALRFADRGVEMDDLLQLASIGMLKAIKSFDFSFGTAFSTYAVPLIIGEIRRFLRDDGIIKVGRDVKRLGRDAMKKREEFISREGREPKLSELASLCGVPPAELADSLEAVSPVRSLSEPCGEEEGELLFNRIADGEDTIGKATDAIALSEAMKKLEPAQRQLIQLRYFRNLSQSRTGEILGMTQVKVSREEKKIMEILREEMEGR